MSLEVEVAVDSPETADGIVEGAVVGRAQVLLDVAGLEMVEDVGDFEAAEKLDTVAVELEVEGILDFGVEANEAGKSPGFVALADVIPVDTHVGVGEARVHVENGDELKTLGELDDAPEQDTVGSVVGKRAVLIGANERIR